MIVEARPGAGNVSSARSRRMAFQEVLAGEAQCKGKDEQQTHRPLGRLSPV